MWSSEPRPEPAMVEALPKYMATRILRHSWGTGSESTDGGGSPGKMSVVTKALLAFAPVSAQELGLIRKPASFMTSICDERGQELIYAGMPITEVFKEEMGIGGVLGLLWFQRR